MSNKTPMTKEAAARIQSTADKSNSNQDFKVRAQRAGDKNAAKGSAQGGKRK